MFRLLSRLSKAFSTPKSPALSGARFEPLEQRALFSVSFFLDAAATLAIASDSSSDRVTVSQLTRGTASTADDTLVTTWTSIAFTPGSTPVIRSSFREFPVAQVARILFRGNDGSDTFYNNTNKPCIAYGGNGNDILVGGGGDDILVGDAGNDRLTGRAGNGT
jgi:hypothetical protein